MATRKLKDNKKYWRPKAGEGFWFIRLNSDELVGPMFSAHYCPNDEAFELFDKSIYRTKYLANKMVKALKETYKRITKEIYK